jgi:hypothetical protein
MDALSKRRMEMRNFRTVTFISLVALISTMLLEGCGGGGGGGGSRSQALTLESLLQGSGTNLQGSTISQISGTAPSFPLYGSGSGGSGALFLNSPYYSSIGDYGSFIRYLNSGVAGGGSGQPSYIRSVLGPYADLFYGSQSRSGRSTALTPPKMPDTLARTRAASLSRDGDQPVSVETGFDQSTGYYYKLSRYADKSAKADMYTDSAMQNLLGSFAAGVAWNNGQSGQYPATIQIGYKLPIGGEQTEGITYITLSDSQGSSTEYKVVYATPARAAAYDLILASGKVTGFIKITDGQTWIRYDVNSATGGDSSYVITASNGLQGAYVLRHDKSGRLTFRDSNSNLLSDAIWDLNGAGTATFDDGTTLRLTQFSEWGSAGARLRGNLAAGDEQGSIGNYIDRYKCIARTSGSASVDMTSSQVNAYLAVFRKNPDGTFDLVSQDDNSGGGTNARATFIAVTGTEYHVAATAGAYQTGSYALTFSAELGSVSAVGGG